MASANEVRAGRVRRLNVAVGLNIAIVAVQVVFGLVARSVGLLADAAHNVVDVAAILLTMVAVRLTARRPTAERSFGYHRSTVLAALVVLGGGRVLSMRSTALHLGADGAASLGVAASGAVILATGAWYRLDPVMSLAIAALIAVQGVRLMRDASDVLLESTPAGLDIAEVARTMESVPGVEEVHDLHAWSLSTDVIALSAHLVMAGHPTLEEAQEVADRVKRAVAGPFGIAHATLELECETCVPDGADPCAMETLGTTAGSAE